MENFNLYGETPVFEMTDDGFARNNYARDGSHVLDLVFVLELFILSVLKDGFFGLREVWLKDGCLGYIGGPGFSPFVVIQQIKNKYADQWFVQNDGAFLESRPSVVNNSLWPHLYLNSGIYLEIPCAWISNFMMDYHKEYLEKGYYMYKTYIQFLKDEVQKDIEVELARMNREGKFGTFTPTGGK